MKRTTISLPDKLHERLQHEAASRGVPMSALIREGVEAAYTVPSTWSAAVSMNRALEALPADTRRRVLQAAKQNGDDPEHLLLLAIEDKTAFVRRKSRFLSMGAGASRQSQ